MTVAAISSIFIVMVAGQNQQQQPTEGDDAGPQQAGNGNQTATVGGADTTTITIPQGAAAQTVQQYYEPDPAEVTGGSEVTWQNEDSAPHTATADDGSFDTGNIAAGQSGSATVQGQGEISYHCTIHPFMTATLQVSGDGGPDQQQPQAGNQTQQAGDNQTGAQPPSAANATQAGGQQTQTAAQPSQLPTNISDAVQQLQQLSPNELAQALQQLGQNYQEAATALGGNRTGQQAQAQNDTSIAGDLTRDTQQQPDNQTTPSNGPAANVTRSGVGQNATQQLNATLLDEARETVRSVIKQLNNVTSSPQ